MVIRMKSANSSNDGGADDAGIKSEAADKDNVRILSKPLSVENLLAAQRSSIWPYISLVIAVILLFIVGYFAWFFQSQYIFLQQKLDNFEVQVDTKFSSANLERAKFEKSYVKSLDGAVSRLGNDNVRLNDLVLNNQKQLKQQQLLLTDPKGMLEHIKANSRGLMAVNLLENVSQALMLGQVKLANKLWFSNQDLLGFYYPAQKNEFVNISQQISKISKVSNLSDNSVDKIVILSKLYKQRHELVIIDVSARYKQNFSKGAAVTVDHQLPHEITHKLSSDKQGSSAVGWWDRQLNNSKYYAVRFWSKVQAGFVVNNNEQQTPLLISFADRVDAYRVIGQGLLQMQWALVSKDSVLFAQIKHHLHDFIIKNIQDTPKRTSWLGAIGRIRLDDNSKQMQHLQNDLARLSSELMPKAI